MPFGSALPVVAAPMAGGGTTPALVEAVTTAGGFAFLPAGYKTAEALEEQLAGLSVEAGVNLFVPSEETIAPDAFRAYADELQPDADRYGLDLRSATPVVDDDQWAAKVDVLVAHPVPWVSFTFGLPDAASASALRRAGSRLAATVTTVDEARRAADFGVDALVVQGSDAGGHSGTFDPTRPITPTDTAAVVSEVVAATGLPVVGAGGVDGPERVARVLAAGADAVAVGTLFLRSDEAGTSATHRAALADPRFTETTIARAFTGRPARGLRNAFVDAHEATAPVGYPALHHLTRELRAKAAAAGDPDRVHLWAGTGYRAAEARPAAEILRGLVTRLH